MELYEQSLKSIQTFLETGYVDQAIKMLGALEQAFPDKKYDLMLKKARILIDCDEKKDALLLLTDVLETGEDERAFKIIKEEYLDPSKAKYLEKYDTNRKIVSGYKNFYGKNSENPDFIVIFKDDDLIVAINENTKEIQGYKKVDLEYSSVEPEMCFIECGFFEDQLKLIEDMTKTPEGYNGLTYAIIAAYQEWEWDIFLQICDMSSFIDTGRYVFAVGTGGIKALCEDPTLAEPSIILGLCAKEKVLYPVYKQLMAKRHEMYERVIDKYKEEYRKEDDELKDRIKKRKPRIMFFTSRFTTVLQFHSKNLMKAAEKLGCECITLIEADDIRRVTDRLLIDTIDDFMPDVIFMLDHFRHKYSSYFSDRTLCVTWIQDFMDHIMNPSTYERLVKRDVVLNHAFTYEKLEKLYPDKMIPAPVPSNQEIYKPYNLSDEEQAMYRSDICFVCHASDVENWLEDLLNSFSSDEVKKFVRDIVSQYRKAAYEGNFIYSEVGFKDYILREAAQHGYELNESGVDYLSKQFFLWLNQRVFRQCIVDWIIDAGFTDIKLWGNGWKNEPKYEKYAMGPAENGEVLSKIYQASKIVVGNNIMTTAAARAWESMLSGAFYISNYIPKEYDLSDIRKILPEGTFEMYHNKDELIEKLHYYLEHEEERRKMAEIGRQEALNRMTFDALMKKVLDVLPDYIDQ